MLKFLLKKLRSQETAGLFDFSIVVVDNDSSGPARDIVFQLREELGLEISYEIEPVQTIPAARNHALILAHGNYIAIIDDDEFPPPYWLVTLYRAIQTFDVDGALGPVYPFFREKPPAWLVRSRTCERPVIRTGTLLDWLQTRTGNVLLKKEIISRGNLSFNMAMETGGSDHWFFRDAIDKGFRFVATEEAPVYEQVPPERFKKSYYVKRALIQGSNNSKMLLTKSHGFSRIPIAMRSAIALFAYALALPFSICLGNRLQLKCLESGSYHLSMLLTMFGIVMIKKRDF
jgi:glycosyltransferase involved in cell wall biosynthesis